MIQPTCFSPTNTSAVAPPVAGLEAKLTRLQKELSDCVNCASAKSVEGKRKIQEVSDKIGSVKLRLDKITVQVKQVDDSKETNIISASQNLKFTQASDKLPNTTGTIGSIINISA